MRIFYGSLLPNIQEYFRGCDYRRFSSKSFEQSSRLIISSLAILVSGITFLFLLPTYSRHSIMQQWWLCVPYQLISPAMVYCPHSQWLCALIWAVLHPAKFSVVLLATVERKILSPAWRLRINSLWIPDTGLILILRCMPFTNNGYAHRAPITLIAV